MFHHTMMMFSHWVEPITAIRLPVNWCIGLHRQGSHWGKMRHFMLGVQSG